MEDIRAAIRRKYKGVARGAQGYFSYTVGREGALALGYDQGILDTIPDDMLCAFCGVGNPFAIALIATGSAVLDIGCGVGIDLYVASRLVGPTGRVCGVDLTEEMVAQARANLLAMHAGNAAVRLVLSERLPLPDAVFDVVIANGVINLSPDKIGLFAEIHRVLKPGGRLQFADIIRDQGSPPPLDVESWSQ